MGQGRSRTDSVVSRQIVDYETSEGNVLGVDLDTDLIDSKSKEYVDGVENFSISPEELQRRIDATGIYTAYDWDLGLDFDEDGKVIFDEASDSLRYHILNSVMTADTIQKAFREATGVEDSIIYKIYFGVNIDNDSPNTKAYVDHFLFDSSEENIFTSFGVLPRQYKTTIINMESSSSALLDKELVSTLKSGKPLYSKLDELTTFVSERSSAHNGWFAMSGSFASSTVAHEAGHAVMAYLEDQSTQLSSKGATRYSNSAVKSWFEDTRGNPVSGYAQYNYKEAFAESFCLYVYGGKSSSAMYSKFCDMMRDYGLESMKGCLS